MITQSCEICKGQPILKGGMLAKLGEAKIDPNEFLRANSRQRFDLLVNGFNSRKDRPEIRTNIGITNTGLLIIKPEMMIVRQRIHTFLTEKMGIEIVSEKSFVYTPEEYWHMHGDILDNFLTEIPHAALIYLLSITEPSEAITFRHLKPDDYRAIFLESSPDHRVSQELESSQDPQQIFTELFVRHPDKTSMRGGICREEVEKRGLLTMNRHDCQSTCWDFANFFRGRTKEQNARTFNGVHSPRNQEELNSDLSVLTNLY